MEHQLQSRYIALAGIQQAFKLLQDDSTPTFDGLNDGWTNNEARCARQSVGAGSFTIHAVRRDPLTQESKEVYGLVDEERKINLNTAPPEVLTRLLQLLGTLKETEIAVIVDSILDWRDEDKEKRPYGAETFYYMGLDDPYECKDGKFENVEEILFVKGMTPEIFSALAPNITVTGSGRVNINTAGSVVLKALGLSEAGIKGITLFRVGEDNVPGTADDRVLSATSSIPSEFSKYCPQEDISRLMELDNQQLLTVNSTQFEFYVTAHVLDDEKNQARIRCIMDRTGQIMAWSEE